MKIVRALILTAVLAAAACGGDTVTVTATDEQTPAPTQRPARAQFATNQCKEGEEVTVTGEAGAKPEVTVPRCAPPNTLVTKDITPGTGVEAVAGSTLSMQYVGIAWSTREQFDASWDTNRPFAFKLGAGMVIKGWDEGIAGMKVGGRRLLVIPSDLGYGERGAGADILPGETLVFVVDLLEVQGG